MSVLINGLLTPGSYYCLFCQVANQSMNIKNHRMLSPIGKAICIMAIIFSSLDMPLGGVSADVLHKTVGAVGGGRGATKMDSVPFCFLGPRSQNYSQRKKKRFSSSLEPTSLIEIASTNAIFTKIMISTSSTIL